MKPPTPSCRHSPGSIGVAWAAALLLVLAAARTTAAPDDPPGDASPFYLEGNADLKDGRNAKAIAAYDHALQLDPQLWKAYHNRGVAYLALEDYDHAIADFGHALEFQPTLAQAFYNRGRAYFYEANFKQAVSDFGEAIRLKPDYADAYNNRGTAYVALKDYPRAYADFKRAVRINPDDQLASQNLEDVQKKLGPSAPPNAAPAPAPAPIAPAHPPESAMSAEPLPTKPEPATERALLQRAAREEGKGEYEKAIADCTKAIRLDATNAAALNDRGTDYAALGQYDLALNDYNAAIGLEKSGRHFDPERARYQCNRGLCHEALGDHADAIADDTLAIQMDPNLLSAHNSLAWTLATCPQARWRDGKRAVAEATKACELSGWKDPACWDTLAAASAEAGDFASAVKWQTKCVESPTLPPSEKPGAQARLALYQARRSYHESY